MKPRLDASKKILKDIEYLFSRINWGATFLDAKAVKIMNELPGKIRKLSESTNKKGGKQ